MADQKNKDKEAAPLREVLLRFENVSFEYGHNHPILNEVDFSVRKGMKVTLMGQNGAGKSTLFKLITGEYKPENGKVQIMRGVSIAMAHQVIPPAMREKTMREFFEACFPEKVYDIDPKIDAVLEVVNLNAPKDRIISAFSGGQQARLLLASALIQDPDLLLLDEPTNNLDKAGIEHLTAFLKSYEKSCMVISHDAEFLNSFTEGVLYLDVHTRKVEQYFGTYYDLLKEITARIERENRKNAQIEKKIQENKDKANFFSHKGGKMRLVAQKMRAEIEEMEENKVDVRKEDKTIRPFTIPMPPDVIGDLLTITSYTTLDPKTHKPKEHKKGLVLKKRDHLLLQGPNGIGKTTLLESLAKGTAVGAKIAPGVRVGYYRQDFSTLNFEHTVREALLAVMEKPDEEKMRATAAGFLLTGDVVGKKIGVLSEGQKGLVAFARLVLERPALLILDEPTNHINFRHLPVIAKALDAYEGAMILVSHVPEFVAQIRIDEILDLGK
ncbi:MAG: ATP-binding cassette domain-containing protein [Candidatus Pacebacteria bacterium]|nr:ATP-binding cassette domain-containing protein [Candidatus Paceibacterota bacterium]